MMKVISLMLIVSALGVSCSKRKNDDYKIQLTDPGKSKTKQDTAIADKKKNEEAEAEAARQQEEADHHVPEINRIIDTALDSINPDSAFDADDVQKVLDQVQDDLKAEMDGIIDPDTESTIAHYELENELEDGLQEVKTEDDSMAKIYVRSVEIADKKIAFYVGKQVKKGSE